MSKDGTNLSFEVVYASMYSCNPLFVLGALIAGRFVGFAAIRVAAASGDSRAAYLSLAMVNHRLVIWSRMLWSKHEAVVQQNVQGRKSIMKRGE